MRWGIVERALWLAVASGIAIYAALTVWLVMSSMFFPYQLDYGEGIVLWFTRQLALGQPIYKGMEGAPYVSSNYPPLAMLLLAPFYPLFGDSYVMGRWLSFAALLVTTAFIVRFVRGATRRWRAGLLGALLFFGSTFVYHWSPLFRVDLLGLAFTLAGVFFVWRWEQEAEGRSWKAGGERRIFDVGQSSRIVLGWAWLFFLAALYTKHSLVFAPIAAGAAIFWRAQRAGIVFAVALSAIGGTIFLILEIITRGGWSFGLFTSNATVWTMRVFAPLMQSFVQTYAVLLALAAWAWLGRLRRLRARRRPMGVLELYAVAALVSLALAGREGAWENYFLEAITMVCVFAGIAIAQWEDAAMHHRWALPLLLLVQLGLFWNDHDPRIAMRLLDEVRVGSERIAPLVRAAQGTVISEDMGLLVTTGKPVEYYTFPYSTLARAGRWDQHWELENLRAGKFPLVILLRGTREDVDHLGNFTRAFVSALDYGYALTIDEARYQVYTPAPLQFLAPRANFDDRFELVGWSLTPADLVPGSTMQLTIVWRALQPMRARYTTFVHLEDESGRVVAQDDHEPRGGLYPTTRWAQGEMVRETYRLRVPSALNGRYFLRVGWYESTTQERLGQKNGEDFVQLREFTVP